MLSLETHIRTSYMAPVTRLKNLVSPQRGAVGFHKVFKLLDCHRDYLKPLDWSRGL